MSDFKIENSERTLNISQSGLINAFELYFDKPAIFVCSYICDAILIIVLIKSKSLLIKTEVFILFFFCFYLILTKLKFTHDLFAFNKNIHYNKTFCIVMFTSITIDPQLYFVLFYYSIYHFSLIDRKKIFLKVNFYVKKKNFFFIYCMVTLILMLTTVIVLTFSLNELKSNRQRSGQCFFYKLSLIEGILYDSLIQIPAALTITVYLICMGVILKRINDKRSLLTERSKKKFWIIFKFFLFTILSNSMVLIWFFDIIDFFSNKESEIVAKLIRIFMQISIVVFQAQSFLIIFIHKKLKITIKKLLFNFFKKGKNFLKQNC